MIPAVAIYFTLNVSETCGLYKWQTYCSVELKYDDEEELVVCQADIDGAYVIRGEESSIEKLVCFTLKDKQHDLLGT